MILAFSGNPRDGGSVGGRGHHHRGCVSLPAAPSGAGGTGSASTVTQAG